MLKMKGTIFEKKVWKEIIKIPRGEVRSYKEIAIAISSPNSARAVANACSKNPNLLIIPCHRVILSNGKIGDYSEKGGAVEKKKILKKERVNFF